MPSIYDLAKTEEQRQLMRFVFSSVEFGRPYVLPPDSPPELVALMRKAFADAVNDPELVAEAERLKLDMTYRPPGDLVKLVANLYQTPPSIIDTVKKLVPNICSSGSQPVSRRHGVRQHERHAGRRCAADGGADLEHPRQHRRR